ncbi:MAG TPA: response regulator transcription factor [Caulobacterales bacterium]|nr:response regulator transcription factor [Caulobacterales bacterium]
MPSEATVLVVEDDAALRRSLVVTLKAAGYAAIGAGSLDEARRLRAHHKPHAVLLDLGLPDGDGLTLIAGIRQSALTPIIVLTARDAEALKVRALDAGADDYVTKPFGVEELLARLRAALRHGVQAGGSPPVVRTGPLEIDLAARVVKRDGREIDLSPKEYELLALLAARLGAVVRHGDLLKSLWGSERADIQYLRVYIAQLRGKLEKGGETQFLISDPGVGYRLVALPAT